MPRQDHRHLATTDSVLGEISKQVQPTRTALLAHVTEQSPEVIDVEQRSDERSAETIIINRSLPGPAAFVTEIVNVLPNRPEPGARGGGRSKSR